MKTTITWESPPLWYAVVAAANSRRKQSECWRLLLASSYLALTLLTSGPRVARLSPNRERRISGNPAQRALVSRSHVSPLSSMSYGAVCVFAAAVSAGLIVTSRQRNARWRSCFCCGCRLLPAVAAVESSWLLLLLLSCLFVCLAVLYWR